MSHPPIANVVRAERCIAYLGNGLHLIVGDEMRGQMHAQIYRGQWPNGDRLVFFPFKLEDAFVSQIVQPLDGIWFGHMKVTLPWIELLKVADYLQLPIDVPKSGEQVPA